MTDQYLVVGNPIAQSLSPRIHRQFAAQTEQDLSYAAQLIEQGDFDNAAAAFFGQGGCGMNVTAPFKEDAYRFAARLTARARAAGAVNTLTKLPDGSIEGDTTDGFGLLTDLQQVQGFDVAAKKILVLGAGGAVRGVLGPLLAASPELLHISNRTASKAEQLATAFSNHGLVRAVVSEQLAQQQYDLVINGTSASLSSQSIDLPAAMLAKDCLCYDMVYSANPTPFMRWATEHGARSSDGLGMLVCQAAESFSIWRDVMPDFVKVIENLRQHLLTLSSS